VQSESEPKPQHSPFRIPIWLGFCLFLAIALFFLWEEHKAHILGALPYALLLLCPIIHLFMHRGHGGREHDGPCGAPPRRRPLMNHERDVPAYGLWSLVIINSTVWSPRRRTRWP